MYQIAKRQHTRHRWTAFFVYNHYSPFCHCKNTRRMLGELLTRTRVKPPRSVMLARPRRRPRQCPASHQKSVALLVKPSLYAGLVMIILAISPEDSQPVFTQYMLLVVVVCHHCTPFHVSPITDYSKSGYGDVVHCCVFATEHLNRLNVRPQAACYTTIDVPVVYWLASCSCFAS